MFHANIKRKVEKYNIDEINVKIKKKEQTKNKIVKKNTTKKNTKKHLFLRIHILPIVYNCKTNLALLLFL